jgi:hypothetical protein
MLHLYRPHSTLHVDPQRTPPAVILSAQVRVLRKPAAGGVIKVFLYI